MSKATQMRSNISLRDLPSNTEEMLCVPTRAEEPILKHLGPRRGIIRRNDSDSPEYTEEHERGPSNSEREVNKPRSHENSMHDQKTKTPEKKCMRKTVK